MQLEYTVLLLFLFLFKCTEKKKHEQIEPIPAGVIVKYSDDTYINLVMDIKYSDGSYYVIDGEYKTLYILDHNFNQITAVGSPGRGPNEFSSMNSVFVNDSHFYVSDYVANVIRGYNKATLDIPECIEPEIYIKLPERVKIGPGDFYLKDSTFYFHSRINLEYWIVSYNTVLDKIQYFGKRSDNTYTEHLSLIMGDNDILLGVPRYSNTLYLFSLENEALARTLDIDLPDEGLLLWREMRNKGMNTPLFTDAYWYDGSLFIGFQDFPRQSRGIAQVTFTDGGEINDISFRYLLPKNGDDVICINKESIVTYSIAKRAIQLYH